MSTQIVLGPFQQATILGGFLQAGLFGVYTCIFFFTVWRTRDLIRRRVPAHLVNIAIYVMTLVTVCADMVVAWRSLFVNTPFNIIGDPVLMESTDYWIRTVQDAFTFVPIILFDCLVCWRFYVIWGRNKIMLILPALCVFTEFVCDLVPVIFDISLAIHGPNAAYIIGYWRVINGACILTLCYNICVTGLIVYRLAALGNRLIRDTGAKTNRYAGIIRVFVEGGCLFAAIMALFLGCAYTNRLLPLTVTTICLPVIVGISATLIMLRLTFDTIATPQSTFPTGRVTNTRIVFAGANVTADSSGSAGDRRRSYTADDKDGNEDFSLKQLASGWAGSADGQEARSGYVDVTVGGA